MCLNTTLNVGPKTAVRHRRYPRSTTSTGSSGRWASRRCFLQPRSGAHDVRGFPGQGSRLPQVQAASSNTASPLQAALYKKRMVDAAVRDRGTSMALMTVAIAYRIGVPRLRAGVRGAASSSRDARRGGNTEVSSVGRGLPAPRLGHLVI